MASLGGQALGCAARIEQEDGASNGADERLDQVGANADPLLGTAEFSNCTSAEATFGNRALAAARFIAVSKGFRDCIGATMTTAHTLRHHGNLTLIGPYAYDAGDPEGSTGAQIENAAFAATSTTNMKLSCNNTGHTQIGWWNEDREAPEEITLGSTWRAFATQDNGASTTTAQFYQPARQMAANTFWHEAMHQWDYHGEETTKVPSIIGSCMETVMNRSASCTNTCASGQRPVASYVTATCECVDDPANDVGVVPDTTSCTTLPGRAPDNGLELFMDNEDDAGSVNSSTSGWVGAQPLTAKGNVTFRFCRAPGRLFGKLRTTSTGQNYAVARMGTACPTGSSPFYRTWDNEDDGNDNYSRGHLPPHVQRKSDGGSYTRIEYCIFQGSSAGTMTAFPSLMGVVYGVLGPANLLGALSTGTIFTDDENSNNSNDLGGSTSGTNVFLTATSGGNTELRFARVR